MSKYTPKKQRHIRRIKRFISSAEKRGYSFPQELKENLTTYSVQKLKTLTPQRLYKQATYGTGEYTMSGERARYIERSTSAKKGARTRARRQWIREHQAEINAIDTSSYDYDDYTPKFTDIVLSNIEEMIEQAKSHKWAQIVSNGNILDAYLQQEISNYGRDKVATACEQAPDETKAQALACLQSSNDEQAKAHALSMVMVIRGHIPTVEESKEFTEEFDNLDSDYLQNNI